LNEKVSFLLPERNLLTFHSVAYQLVFAEISFLGAAEYFIIADSERNYGRKVESNSLNERSDAQI